MLDLIRFDLLNWFYEIWVLFDVESIDFMRTLDLGIFLDPKFPNPGSQIYQIPKSRNPGLTFPPQGTRVELTV